MKFILIVSTFLLSLSVSAADNYSRVHFAAQEISMQTGYRDVKLNTASMCYLLGSIGKARAELKDSLQRLEQEGRSIVDIPDMKRESDAIEAIVKTLSSLCDAGGRVILNSAVQPVEQFLIGEKRPLLNSPMTLFHSLEKSANNIVRMNTRALKNDHLNKKN